MSPATTAVDESDSVAPTTNAATGGKPRSGPNRPSANVPRQHLHRSEAEDVARLFAYMAEREVEADVEQQKHDPELGERRDGGAVGDEVQADAAQR